MEVRSLFFSLWQEVPCGLRLTRCLSLEDCTSPCSLMMIRGSLYLSMMIAFSVSPDGESLHYIPHEDEESLYLSWWRGIPMSFITTVDTYVPHDARYIAQDKPWGNWTHTWQGQRLPVLIQGKVHHTDMHRSICKHAFCFHTLWAHLRIFKGYYRSERNWDSPKWTSVYVDFQMNSRCV